MRNSYSNLYLASVLGSICFTSIAAGTQHTFSTDVIYSEIVSDPTSAISGLPGMPIKEIGRPFLSPNGMHSILTLKVMTGTTNNDALVVRDGQVVVREGTAPAYLPLGRAHDGLDMGLRILNSGAFAFAGDLSGDVTTDDIVCVGDPSGTITLVAQEGQPIPGGPTGWQYDFLDSPILTDLGHGFRATGIDGSVPAGLEDVVQLHGSFLLQTGVDFPAGSSAGPSDFWDVFDTETLFVSSDGANSLIQGDLTNNAFEDDVIVVNGTVVLQEGSPISGSAPTDLIATSGIRTSYMADNGDWIAHGFFENAFDGWVVHNGLLVAREGNPIHAGSTEVFDSVFTFSACNRVGDYVVAGSSDANITNDAVVVLNNQRVLCREGDPIDLDGNGSFDDGLFVSVINLDEAVLTDDLKLHMVVILRNGSGTPQGEAYLVIDGGSGSGLADFCDPADNNSTGFPTSLVGTFGSGAGSDLHLRATQGPPGQFGYFLIGTGFADPGIAIGQGHLCLSTVGGNAFGRYNVAGGALNSIGQFDAAGVLQNLVGTSAVGSGYDIPSTIPISGFANIAVGETWYFQAWHRDIGVSSNFSNGLSVVF